MKRELRWKNSALAAALLVRAGGARAKETRRAPTQGQVVIQEGGVAGAQEGPGPIMIQGGVGVEGDSFFADHIELLGFGGLHGGKVVKGAPFSAVSGSATSQVLAGSDRSGRTTQ